MIVAILWVASFLVIDFGFMAMAVMHIVGADFGTLATIALMCLVIGIVLAQLVMTVHIAFLCSKLGQIFTIVNEITNESIKKNDYSIN